MRCPSSGTSCRASRQLKSSTSRTAGFKIRNRTIFCQCCAKAWRRARACKNCSLPETTLQSILDGRMQQVAQPSRVLSYMRHVEEWMQQVAQASRVLLRHVLMCTTHLKSFNLAACRFGDWYEGARACSLYASWGVKSQRKCLSFSCCCCCRRRRRRVSVSTSPLQGACQRLKRRTASPRVIAEIHIYMDPFGKRDCTLRGR